MNWPDSNLHHDDEYFPHPPRPTHPSTCLGARLWAWLSPHNMPSENSAPLFTGPRASSNFSSLTPPLQCYPPDLFPHRWSWCDIESGAALLILLESRILDHQRLAAQTNRLTDIESSDSTRRGRRTSPFALLPKCLTRRVSLQELQGATNDF